MDIKTNDLFWNAELEELINGFADNRDEYRCIVCGEIFEKGRIYESDNRLYDSRKAAELHIKSAHGSMLNYLLGLNPAFTGLTHIQIELLSLISQGLSDKEMAAKLGVAQSTIRNHRYKLREKEKQAKLVLALMNLLSNSTSRGIGRMDKEELCDAHVTATSVDDRYNITDREKADAIKAHMDAAGALKSYPSKEKKKIIVLEEIAKNFTRGKTYSEQELNRILKRIYEDYATIRRALIEYGFIERTDDCSSYWVKE